MSSEPWAPLSIVYVNTSEALPHPELVSDDSLFVDATAHNMGLVSQLYHCNEHKIPICNLGKVSAYELSFSDYSFFTYFGNIFKFGSGIVFENHFTPNKN